MNLQNYRYKIKARNFSDEIENWAKFKKIYENNIEAFNNRPFQWVKEIILNETIVFYNEKYFLKGYMYKGVLSSVDISNEVFAQLLELIDRPKIKKIK